MARDHAKIDISLQALRSMTPAQHEALAANVLGEGMWEAQDEFRIRHHGQMDEPDVIMVQVMKEGQTTIFLGIEWDGYTHS